MRHLLTEALISAPVLSVAAAAVEVASSYGTVLLQEVMAPGVVMDLIGRSAYTAAMAMVLLGWAIHRRWLYLGREYDLIRTLAFRNHDLADKIVSKEERAVP